MQGAKRCMIFIVERRYASGRAQKLHLSGYNSIEMQGRDPWPSSQDAASLVKNNHQLLRGLVVKQEKVTCGKKRLEHETWNLKIHSSDQRRCKTLNES